MRAFRVVCAFLFASLLTASAASAVSLDPHGIGEVLIYPYYTVNKNQDTLVSIANASDTGKVVTVFVMEGYNGRSVLDFTLMLSPHDVWTAAITETGDDGGGVLRTSDTSCTDPAIPAEGATFSASAYDGTGPQPADQGPQGITRTREGFIAVVARADIDPASDLAQATTHVQSGTPGGGVPPGCGDVDDVLITAGALPPTNGLYGSGTIIDVGLGTFFAYNADALANYSDTSLYTPASSLFRPFVDANSEEATHGVARSYSSNATGQLVVADWAFGVDAVSAVLMADSIYNEYFVSPALGANTDWVITFPTKAMYVDELYGTSVPFPPFVEAFHAPGESNVVVAANIHDREERSGSLYVCEPPICAQEPVLHYEVNVLGFGDAGTSDTSPVASPVLGSHLQPFELPPIGASGHMVMDLASGDVGHFLPGGIGPDGGEIFLQGLPVVGFMVYNIINTNAQPGLLANYGGLFAHRATTSCFGAAPCPLTGQ
jgi:hypothetical protein